MIDVTILLGEGRGEILALQGSSKLARYKVQEPISHLTFLYPRYIVAASCKKPLLYVWNLGQDSTVQKYVLPGLATALTTSPCGNYLAVGVDNSLRIWHLPSGQQIVCLSGHYQKISSLVWRGGFLISGADDNTINVWQSARVITNSNSTHSPLHTFTVHSMPVTDLFCGLGGPRCRLFSVSLDNTSQIWEVTSGRHLLSLEFPAPLSKLLVDKMESVTGCFSDDLSLQNLAN
eukprot:sb/3469351/